MKIAFIPNHKWTGYQAEYLRQVRYIAMNCTNLPEVLVDSLVNKII